MWNTQNVEEIRSYPNFIAQSTKESGIRFTFQRLTEDGLRVSLFNSISKQQRYSKLQAMVAGAPVGGGLNRMAHSIIDYAQQSKDSTCKQTFSPAM